MQYTCICAGHESNKCFWKTGSFTITLFENNIKNNNFCTSLNTTVMTNIQYNIMIKSGYVNMGARMEEYILCGKMRKITETLPCGAKMIERREYVRVWKTEWLESTEIDRDDRKHKTMHMLELRRATWHASTKTGKEKFGKRIIRISAIVVCAQRGNDSTGIDWDVVKITEFDGRHSRANVLSKPRCRRMSEANFVKWARTSTCFGTQKSVQCK